jgi:hypothetical protein
MVIKAAGQMPFGDLISSNHLSNSNGKVSILIQQQILKVCLREGIV